jgi:hypothetical protein
MKITGIVEKYHVAQGSKSDRIGMVLSTPSQRYILRRVNGNPLELDPSIEVFEGKKVICEGIELVGSVFEFNTIKLDIP